MGEVTSRLRKSISKWANADDQHARDLRATYATVDCTPIDEAPDRERVKLRGTLRTVTLRPRGGIRMRVRQRAASARPREGLPRAS